MPSWIQNLAVPLLGIGASAYIANKNNKAAQKAIEKGNAAAVAADTAGTDKSLAEIRRQFDLISEQTQPMRDVNTAALDRLMAMAGMKGNYDFRGAPGHQFALNEGLKAIERGASAGGRLGSGRTMKEMARYAEDYADTKYGNEWERIARLAGLGANGLTMNVNAANAAGGNAANIISRGAENLANLYRGSGRDEASIHGAYNTTAQGAIQGLMDAFNYSQMLSRIPVVS